MRSVVAGAFVGCCLLAGSLHAYPYGYVPETASLDTVKSLYEEWKSEFVTSENTADPETMLRVVGTDGRTISEEHAYGMVLAAYLEDTDETFKKLWAYAQSHLGPQGLMSYEIAPNDTVVIQGSSSGADVDMGIALDRAAIRWPDSDLDWDWIAQLHLRKCYNHRVENYALRGVGKSFYMNHFATGYMNRFEQRTGNKSWYSGQGQNNVVLGCFLVTAESMTTYALPPTLVGGNHYIPTIEQEGTEGDTANVAIDTAAGTYGLQAARFSWRIGQHGLLYENFRINMWVKKLYGSFADSLDGATDITNIKSAHLATDGTVLNSETSPATIGPAGIVAMAAAEWCDDTSGAKDMADAAWQYCADWTPGDSVQPMEQSLRLMYMLVMSGEFDLADTTRGVYPPEIIVIIQPGNAEIFPEGSDVEFFISAVQGGKPIDKIDIMREDSVVGSIQGVDGETQYRWTWESLPKGSYDMKTKAYDADGRYSEEKKVTFFIGSPLEILPYNGSPVSIPGEIVAVEYDNGGEGIAYHDHDPFYRKGDGVPFRNEGVDHAPLDVKDTSKGYFIGWTNPAREWINYTIEVTKAGTYDIGLTVATTFLNRAIHLEMEDFPEDVAAWNGEDITGPIEVPTELEWENFSEVVVKDVELAEGVKRLRVFWDSGGVNLRKIRILEHIESSVNDPSKRTALSRIGVRRGRNTLLVSGMPPRTRVLMTSINGRTLVYTPAADRHLVDLSGMAPGLYLLQVQTRTGERRMLRKILRK
jgi:hypothetical protein